MNPQLEKAAAQNLKANDSYQTVPRPSSVTTIGFGGAKEPEILHFTTKAGAEEPQKPADWESQAQVPG